MAVNPVFDEEKYQRERGSDTNGEQYFLDRVRHALLFGHPFMHHAERLDHNDHVQ